MTFFLFPARPSALFIGIFIFLISATVKSEAIQSELQDESVQLILEQNTDENIFDEIERQGDGEYEKNEDDDFSTCSKQNILGVTACRKICSSAAANGKSEGDNFCIESEQLEGIVCDCSSKSDSRPPEICDSKLSRVFTDLESEEDCADFCTAQEKLAYGCRVNVDSDFVPTCACFADPEAESVHAEKRDNPPRFKRVCKRPGKNKYCKKRKPKNKRPKPKPRPPQVEAEEGDGASKYPKKPVLERLKVLKQLVEALITGMKDVGDGFNNMDTSVTDLTTCIKDDKGIYTTKVPDDADKIPSPTETETDTKPETKT